MVVPATVPSQCLVCKAERPWGQAGRVGSDLEVGDLTEELCREPGQKVGGETRAERGALLLPT